MRSRSLSRNFVRAHGTSKAPGSYEFHEFHLHYDEGYGQENSFRRYIHDRDTDTVQAYLRHPLLDFPPTPLHTLSSLASYRRLGIYDDSIAGAAQQLRSDFPGGADRHGPTRARQNPGSPAVASDEGATRFSSFSSFEREHREARDAELLPLPDFAAGQVHPHAVVQYPDLDPEIGSFVTRVDERASGKLTPDLRDVPSRVHLVAPDTSQAPQLLLISARRTSSLNSASAPLDLASRDGEGKGRGMRRSTSERSFRGTPATPGTAPPGTRAVGGGGGGGAADASPQRPLQGAHVATHSPPHSAPHSNPHPSLHTCVPHNSQQAGMGQGSSPGAAHAQHSLIHRSTPSSPLTSISLPPGTPSLQGSRPLLNIRSQPSSPMSRPAPSFGCSR